MSSRFNEGGNNKKQGKEDESYFTFLAGILLVVVLNLFIIIYKRIFHSIPFTDENNHSNCHCSKCKERMKKYKLKIRKNNINFALYIYIIFFGASLFFLIVCCEKVANSDQNLFDPYQILELSPKASIADVKHSYRTLSLKYHPDKNPNDKKAKKKFMLINKAYRALTNPKAIENYKKYGNPDGPGLITMGLALPKYIFKGKIGNSILTIFAIIIIVILPVWFYFWFKNSSKYNSDGLLNDDLVLFYKLLEKDTSIKNLPFIIGLAGEFKNISIFLEDKELIQNLYKKYTKNFPNNYENLLENKPSLGNILAITVLYVHFFNETIEDKYKESFIKYNDLIISKSIFIVDNIIKMIFSCNKIYDFNFMLSEEINKKKGSSSLISKFDFDYYSIKQLDLKLAKAVINLRSRLIQETNISLANNELLQLPDIQKNIEFLKKNKCETILELINEAAKENNKFEVLKDFNDIKEAINSFPRYKMRIELKSERYEIGDFLTFKIGITRNELPMETVFRKKQLGFLHSNNYQDVFDEEVICIITDSENNLCLNTSRIKFDCFHDYQIIMFNMLAEKMGKNIFNVEIISLNYPGIKINAQTEIEIKEKNNTYANFIKNRVRDMINKEEFEEIYKVNFYNEQDELEEELGEDNERENEKKLNNFHEHQN